MILASLLLFAQVAAPAPMPPQQTAAAQEAAFDACVDLAVADPDKGLAQASAWRLAGGTFLARQCEGMAYATKRGFPAAAAAFEEAARGAEVARDKRSAQYWAQAGNAWLAAGDAAKAKVALDAALAAGTLTGLPLGETFLDRARAQVAAGQLVPARADIDRALETADADPLAWLLSATLARRTGELPRARTDIARALTLSADDAAVQLEAGNIAARSGDEGAAKAAWGRASTLGGTGPAGEAARAALAQFASGPQAGK